MKQVSRIDLRNLRTFLTSWLRKDSWKPNQDLRRLKKFLRTCQNLAIRCVCRLISSEYWLGLRRIEPGNFATTTISSVNWAKKSVFRWVRQSEARIIVVFLLAKIIITCFDCTYKKHYICVATQQHTNAAGLSIYIRRWAFVLFASQSLKPYAASDRHRLINRNESQYVSCI